MTLLENYVDVFNNIKNWDNEYKEDLFKKVIEITPNKNNVSKEQELVLKEIFNTLSELEKALSFIGDYVKYELSCSGGSIRDLVLNKTDSIGDYDIVLHIDEYDYDGFVKLAKQIFPDREVLKEPVKLAKMKTEVIAEILSRALNRKQTMFFNNENDEVKDYKTNWMNGIVKIESDGLKKPLDIILSKSPVSAFMGTFSFDICKGFVKLKNSTNHLDLLDNLILSKEMIKDIKDKTLTVNISDINTEHLNYYMNKHYIKMKDKYPTYKLTCRSNNNKSRYGDDLSQYEKLQELMNFYIMRDNYYFLREDLPINKKIVQRFKI